MHCEKGPDNCFGCKCAYWRTGGGAPLKFTYGREDFHGPTVNERLTRARKEYKNRSGVDPVPAKDFGWD